MAKTEIPVERGHRLRIAVAGADFQNAWPTSQPGVHSIFRGGHCASHIILPAIGRQSPTVTRPDLHKLEPADPNQLLQPTEYSITHNLSEQTTTARLHVESGDSDNRLELKSAFTVSDRSPADAVLKAEGRYRVRRAEYDVEVHSTESTRSDDEEFHHTVLVRITRDGKSFFEKDWSISVPRAGS